MDSLKPRTLSDYARAARRRKIVIIFSMLVAAIATGIAVEQLPNIYESSAAIGIEPSSGESSTERASIDSASWLAAIRQQATNRARLQSLIAKHGLYKEAIEKGARVEDCISQMRSSVSVDRDANREDGANAITISYAAVDPEIAQKVASELAGELIAESEKAAPQVSGEMETLRQRAEQLSTQMNELEQKAPWLVTLGERTHIVSAAPAARSPQYQAEALRAQQMSVESLRDQQYKVQQQLADIERRVAAQRQIVEQQKKGSGLRDNPTYAALIARRAELQGQRDTLINRQELTDKHPRVVAILDQINAINRQIEELRQQDANLISQSPEARELASLESERNRLKIDLEITDREIARRLAKPVQTAPAPATTVTANPARRDAGSSRMAQEYLGLKKTYDEVRGKLETAESKQSASGAKSERLLLLNEASLPSQPVWPNRLLFTLIAAAAGLALGVVFALLAESRRFRSLQNAKDVEYYARLPLLAAIPKTMTSAERRRARLRARMRLAFATVAAAAATFALTKIFIITEVFAIIGKN